MIGRRARLASALETFLYAGTSALLLALVQLYPGLWFLSLLVLVPFLWAGVRAGLTRAIGLGLILAGCYVAVAYPVELWTTPDTFLLKLVALSLIFSIYAISVNRLWRHIGVNAVLMAATWLPLEYALSQHSGLGSIFAFSGAEPVLVMRVGSLFGLLVVSFIVVLVNWLILIVLGDVVRALLSGSALIIQDDNPPQLSFADLLPEKRWYYSLAPRDPPTVDEAEVRFAAPDRGVNPVQLPDGWHGTGQDCP